MDKKEFVKMAKKRGIPNFLYNLDGKGRDDERFNIVPVDGKWNVYYSERGNKTTNKFFDTEDEALRFMLDTLSSVSKNLLIVLLPRSE